MLITVCTDDDELIQAAMQQARTQPRIYGACFRGFEDQFPVLGVTEDLFVTAHGAFETDDVSPRQPVIGDKTHALYLTGAELLANLLPIVPQGYTGRIYISACESADPGGPAALSFADRLLIALRSQGLGGVAVYGHKGAVGLNTPPPNSSQWVRAKAS
jgi:hypothetical protein